MVVESDIPTSIPSRHTVWARLPPHWWPNMGQNMTIRNWNTTTKLLTLINERDVNN